MYLSVTLTMKSTNQSNYMQIDGLEIFFHIYLHYFKRMQLLQTLLWFVFVLVSESTAGA